MPNRILRDWTDSLKFDGLSPEAERLFIRLIMKADDFGRYHADPRLVKSGCFPLAESLRANTVSAWLTELSDRALVFCYTVQDREFLAIYNFSQRLKQSRAKFPPPDGKSADFLPLSDDFREVPGSSGKFPPESETYSDTESESESDNEKKTRGLPPGGGVNWEGLPSELDSEEFRSAWSEFLEFRKEQRFKPLKPKSVISQWSELATWGKASAIESIRQSIRQGWQGLFPPKSQGKQQPPTSEAW